MASSDYSNDYRIVHDQDAGSCTVLFRCFDTPNSICVYGIDGDSDAYWMEDLLVAARRTCLELHRLWSFTMPGSDVSRINCAVAATEVSEHTARLLSHMKEYHEAEPAFDFTVGPVSYLWKHVESVPSVQDVERALEHVGANKVRVADRSVVKDDPFAQVDVGGAAKGYAADLVAGMLREAGAVSADVDFGGNLFMMGAHPQGRPWRVSVRIPEGIETEPIVLELTDEAAVTSGSYERFVEIDGRRYQHIVDASTGYPVESDVVSATVVAPHALEADLLATTACLVGSRGLPDLAMRHPACRFVVITDDARVLRA